MARRATKWFCLTAAVLLLAAACAVGETIKCSKYGFQLTVPDPAKLIVDKQSEARAGSEYQISYVSNNIIYHVETYCGNDPKSPRKTASAHLAELDKTDPLPGLSRYQEKPVDLVTAQGIHAKGAEVAVRLPQDPNIKWTIAEGSAQFYVLASEMFKGSETEINLVMPLNESECRLLSVLVWGAGDNAAGVQSAAKDLIASIKLDRPELAKPTSGADVSAPEPVRGKKLRNDEFGFEATIPESAKYVGIGEDKGIIGSNLEAEYRCGDLLYRMSAYAPTVSAASFAVDNAGLKLAEILKSQGTVCRMLDFVSKQGIHAKGIGSTDKMQKNEDSGYVSDWDKLAQQMFGDSVYSAVLFFPIHETKPEAFAIYIWGAGNNAAGVEQAAKALVESIRLDKPELAVPAGAQLVEPTPAGSPAKIAAGSPETKPKEGEVEYRGAVSYIDKDKKTIDIVATQFTEFGKQPVGLNPGRPMRIAYDSLTWGVRTKVTVAVLGIPSKVGATMKARLVYVPAPPK